MQKYFKFLSAFFLLLLLLFPSCTPGTETANLSPEDKFKEAMALYQDEDYEFAVKEFEALLLQYPGSEISDDAQYYLAQTRFKRGEYLLAAYEFSKLIKNMPASSFLTDSQYYLAECYFQLSPNFSLDQRYTEKAIDEFQAFIEIFGTDSRVTEAEAKIKELREKLALKEFNAANIYEKMEYYNAAILGYTRVTEIFHDTKYAPLASYKKIVLLNTRERFSEALLEIDQFLQKYKNDEKTQEVLNLKKDLENATKISDAEKN